MSDKGQWGEGVLRVWGGDDGATLSFTTHPLYVRSSNIFTIFNDVI